MVVVDVKIGVGVISLKLGVVVKFVVKGKKMSGGKFEIFGDWLFFDFSDFVVKKMMKWVKDCGYIIYDELNEVLFVDGVSLEEIEDFML